MRDCGMSMQVLYINNVVKLHITRKEEETMTQKKFSTKYLVEMALLVAIILIMAFTPIGYIRTAGLEITLIVVPVAVGAVTLGPAAGAILGGVFGVTSFIQCFGMSPFGAALLGINGFLTFLVCVPTRILMGWLTGLIYKGLRKTKLPSGASVTISNLCCPLLNTTFFYGNVSDWILQYGIHPVICISSWCKKCIAVHFSICRCQRTG